MALTPPTPTALPTKASRKTAADTVVAAQQAFWLGEIADQIISVSRGGGYTTFVEDYKVTTANGTALTTAGYTVGSATNGQVQITWS